MPFTEPYKTTFTAGDLIYGLATTRSRLIIQRFAPAILDSRGPSTVDQYRKRGMDALSKANRKVWKSFLRANEVHPKYGRYARAIRSHDNDEESFAEEVTSGVLQNAAWRAKSKFGMEWTLKNQRGTIHFVLDEIDMGAVVTKTHEFANAEGTVLARDEPRGKAPTEGEKERTITHSELRWIYRNRNDPLVQAGVQFWRTDGGAIQACGPPWENDLLTIQMPSGKVITWRNAWKAYKPKKEVPAPAPAEAEAEGGAVGGGGGGAAAVVGGGGGGGGAAVVGGGGGGGGAVAVAVAE